MSLELYWMMMAGRNGSLAVSYATGYIFFFSSSHSLVYVYHIGSRCWPIGHLQSPCQIKMRIFFFSGINSSLLRFIFARDGSPWSSTQIKEAIPNGRITPHAKSYTSNVCGQIIIMFLARLCPNIAESFLGEALCSHSIYGSVCVYVRMYI